METSVTDEELCMRIQAGEHDAFNVLYDRYLDKIYRFIYYKTWNKETAEDIVSTVFMKAYERRASFDAAKGTVSQWLYRIARNTVIDHYRTLKRTVPIEDAFDMGEDDTTLSHTDTAFTMERIAPYLRTLTAKQRELITLRIWEEKSYKEIADIMDTTEDAAKMAFSRTMKQLREDCGPLLPVVLTLIQATKALPFVHIS